MNQITKLVKITEIPFEINCTYLNGDTYYSE